MVVKIETGTETDQFIAFNRATGVNRQNDEADNEVTMVETIIIINNETVPVL